MWAHFGALKPVVDGLAGYTEMRRYNDYGQLVLDTNPTKRNAQLTFVCR